MFRGQHRRVRILYGVADIVLTALAFQLSYFARYALGARDITNDHVFFLTPPVYALLLGWSMLVWVCLAVWFGVYHRLEAAAPRVILRDAFQQCLVGAILVVLLEFALRLDLSRIFLAGFGLWNLALLCLFRLNSGRLLGIVRREFGAPSYVVVVGTGPPALLIAGQIEEAASYGIRLRGFLAEPGEPAPEQIELNAIYSVQPLTRLPAMLREHVIDEVVFAVDSRQLSGLEDVFLMCDEEGVRTRVAVDFFPHIHSHVYLDRLGNSPLLTFSATPHDEMRLLVKRLTDILVAGIGLIVVSPIMALIALFIRIGSPGPAVFRQVRCGLNGRRFVFYKFRSMCADAESMRASLEHLNEKTTAFKIPEDPRLTWLGRWLRKFSIDEWPQLWNVLKGDMSLVGPRPPVPEEVEQYKGWQRRRLRMRPGLTCLWAVKGRDHLDFDTWMKLDMQYIDTWSLGLDWKIILQTIPQVLSGRGAH